MSDINNISLSIIFCSISLIMYIQLTYSSNIKNMTMRKSISIGFLILGVMINPGLGAVFSIFFLPLYINNTIEVFESSFNKGFLEEEKDSFDEAVLIANGESGYYGGLNFPNYDEDMSRFKV